MKMSVSPNSLFRTMKMSTRDFAHFHCLLILVYPYSM
jgi:hypothetical protein